VSTERSWLAGGIGLGGIGGIWAAVHTAAPEGVHLPAAALAIIAILVVALTGVIGGVSLLLLAEKDVQIKEWKRMAERATETSTKAVKLAASGDV
jgi:hypothetical protein